MNDVEVSRFVVDVIIVLASGFVAGAIFRRLNVSLIIGYLIVGAAIGQGGLGWVSQAHHELEYLARAGALFLLFAVGIEFSLEELLRLSRYFLIGGLVQMLLVAIPLALICFALGVGWKAALLIAAAAALSSTILVFKALAEWGLTVTKNGRRAIGILLFQDVALVPLMLLIPLLTEIGEAPTVAAFGILIAKSAVFVAAVVLGRRVVSKWGVVFLSELRSVELLILFALTVLAGTCWVTHTIGLPPAIGALAAGLMLSGNRLSKQIDTLVLPFRESFAAIFFVTLGSLLHPLAFFAEPILLTAGLIGILALKSAAATIALKLTGLGWKSAAGMGIGLAQMGEFSFLLIAEGTSHGLLDAQDYNRMLFIALGSLILTPVLLKFGVRWAGSDALEDHTPKHEKSSILPTSKCALVIGMGLIGRHVAARLSASGFEVTPVDLSPILLHPFEQAGIHTVVGDARQPQVLRRAGVVNCGLVVVCVPHDEATLEIVKLLRELNPETKILVRCRYESVVSRLRNVGADAVVSEEVEASDALWSLCETQISNLNPAGVSNE